tara:strand:+ start:2064 stop:2345 length:282 start_codon:yes stop_codon:yes gene_type:complete
MQKEIIYLIELSQSEIEGLIAVLDTVVKSHGITVAGKCGELHKILVERANPKEESVQPQPEKVEEVSLSEVEDELQQIMEVPKKRKRAARKKK